MRVRDELFYLLPLQSEEKVDEWRRMYNLPPLEQYIRYLQNQFQTVVIKSPRQSAAAAAAAGKNQTSAPTAAW